MHQTFTPPHLTTVRARAKTTNPSRQTVLFTSLIIKITQQNNNPTSTPSSSTHITTTLFPLFISTYPFPSPHPHNQTSNPSPLTPQNHPPYPVLSRLTIHPSIPRGNPSQETWNSASTPGASTPRASPWIDRWRSGSGIRIGYVAFILILIVRFTSLALKSSRRRLLRGALFVSLRVSEGETMRLFFHFVFFIFFGLRGGLCFLWCEGAEAKASRSFFSALNFFFSFFEYLLVRFIVRSLSTPKKK